MSPTTPTSRRSNRVRNLVIALLVVVVASLAVTGTILAASNAGSSSLTKAQRLAQVATQQAVAAHQPHGAKIVGANTPDPTSCPVTFSQPGISTLFNPDFPTEHTINVAAVPQIGSAPYVYLVFAGWQTSNAQQGMIIVEREATDPCKSDPSSANVITTFLTPYQRGGVTLTTLNGAVVSFTTNGGASGRFNFVTGQFV